MTDQYGDVKLVLDRKFVERRVTFTFSLTATPLAEPGLESVLLDEYDP